MDFDHRAPPLAPPPRSDGDLKGRSLLTSPWKKRRPSVDSHTPTPEPPKNRARGGMFDASVADNGLSGAFPTPSPRKNLSGGPFDPTGNLRSGVLFTSTPRKNLAMTRSGPFDLHPQRPACLFAPPPPKQRSIIEPFDVGEDGEEDERSTTLPAPPPPPPPPPPSRRAFIEPFDVDQDGYESERSATLPAPPPPLPRRRSFFDPFEGCEDGDEDEGSATFPAPPPPKGRAFIDGTDVVDDEDGGDDDSAAILIPPAPMRRASGPFEPVPFLQPRDSGGSSSRGRGGSGSRGRGRGVRGGRGRGDAAGPGSRARALAELLGNRESVLTPDGGPAPGQDLKDWELWRNIYLVMEYEYLDRLLRRIKDMPKRARINATERKGWTDFYTRLETCFVVQKQMRMAKCDPILVPDQLMAEVL